MDHAPETNGVVVRNFINQKTTKPLTITEFRDFWQVCSPEERQQFANEARSLMS